MPLQLVPGVDTDAVRGIDIENAAYGPNPINIALFPGPFPSGNESRATTLVQQLHSNDACRWVKVIDPELVAEGRMIAFSMWYIWSAPWPSASKPPPVQWGPGTNPEACELFFGAMRNKWETSLAGKPHIYLKLLHTDPAHQKRGAGSMLLEWGAAEADRLGVPSYLESTEEGRPLYEKFGYRAVDKVTADLSRWGGPVDAESVIMLRAPCAPSPGEAQAE